MSEEFDNNKTNSTNFTATASVDEDKTVNIDISIRDDDDVVQQTTICHDGEKSNVKLNAVWCGV